MKTNSSLLALGLALFGSLSYAQNHVQSGYVYTRNAYIWSQPGYTWRDCAKLETPGSFTDMTELLKVQNICNSRSGLLEAGDKIFIQPDAGRPGEGKYQVHRVLIGGKEQDKKFYEVIYDKRDENGNLVYENGQPVTYRGWMSEDQITTITPDEPETPTPPPTKKVEPPCPPQAQTRPVAKNPVTEVTTAAKQMEEIATNNNLALGNTKTPAEIDHFMCLYRNASISDKDFPAHMAKFKERAAKASQSFNVPYGALMCTLLIESGLYYNPRERDEYKGYGQFGSALIDDLEKIARKSPYNAGLSSYKSRFPNTALTDDNVRSSSDPTHSVAAAAMSLKWIYEERLPASRCRQCSTDGNLNRRDLYLMIAGYNYGPYSIHRYANKTLHDMKNSFPPPKESRNYMTQMDRCLEKGQETLFRVDGRPVSREYNNSARRSFCDKNYK